MSVDLGRAYWLGLLVSVVLPVLVGLVTTRVTNAGVKATLLLALSIITGFVTEYAARTTPGTAWAPPRSSPSSPLRRASSPTSGSGSP
ncbi:hypothetical protein ACFQ51_34630 [Streptomyces kaempferi]